MQRIRFCKTCERQTSEDVLICPHCGQEAPFDRYEDLESGRRVFARIANGDRAWDAVREVNARNGEHLLELVSFDSGLPNFRYKTFS